MSLSSAPISSLPLSDRRARRLRGIALGWGITASALGRVSPAVGVGTTDSQITGRLDGRAVGIGDTLSLKTPPPTRGVGDGVGVTESNITGRLNGDAIGVGLDSAALKLTVLRGSAVGWGYADSTLTGHQGVLPETAQAVGVGLAFSWINSETGVVNWVANNGAYSLYDHFPFTGYAMVGETPIACNSNGVYAIGGALANGNQIQSRVMTGLVQPGGANLSMVDSVVATAQCADSRSIEIVVRREFNGRLVEDIYRPQEMYADMFRALRAKTKRGARSRYWAFGVRNRYGRAFELDTLTINAVPSTRQRK